MKKLMNKLINDDCLKAMQLIEDKSIDLIVCDLPYFKVVKNEWDNVWKTEKEYLNWIKEIIKCYDRIVKDDSNVFIFTSRQLNRKICNILDKYFEEKRIIIWARKRGFNQTRGKALASGYEPIAFYSKGNPVFNNIKIKSTSKRKEYTKGSLKDGITLGDVWIDISALPHNSKEKLEHPTQKPLALIERIVTIGSNESDVVLDNCCGSGTTAVVCEKLNRNWVCIEKEKKYYDIAEKRLQLLRKQEQEELKI